MPRQPGQVPGQGVDLGLRSPGPSAFASHSVADEGGDNFKAFVILVLAYEAGEAIISRPPRARGAKNVMASSKKMPARRVGRWGRETANGLESEVVFGVALAIDEEDSSICLSRLWMYLRECTYS